MWLATVPEFKICAFLDHVWHIRPSSFIFTFHSLEIYLVKVPSGSAPRNQSLSWTHIEFVSVLYFEMNCFHSYGMQTQCCGAFTLNELAVSIHLTKLDFILRYCASEMHEGWSKQHTQPSLSRRQFGLFLFGAIIEYIKPCILPNLSNAYTRNFLAYVCLAVDRISQMINIFLTMHFSYSSSLHKNRVIHNTYIGWVTLIQ